VGLTIRIDALDEDRDPVWGQDQINAALAEHGIDARYALPEGDPLAARKAAYLEDMREDGNVSMPYSFIHYLRRFAVRLRLDPSWTPTPIDDPDEDEVYRSFFEDYFDTPELSTSHLVCHSDSEGFYVPIDFEEVIFDTNLPGRLLGSSVRLLDELRALAVPLGVRFDGDRPDLVDREIEEDVPYFRELESWLCLYEAARLSVALKSAIVFS
jgi:hypothetical protein